MTSAIATSNINHWYGARHALRDFSLQIDAGEIFAVLGPNGGGKTTLFRLLSTLIPLRSGSAHVAGFDLASQTAAVRTQIGVVFQSPSLDKKLSVLENLLYAGRIYGLHGRDLRFRATAMLQQVGLADRAAERVEKLSGGLRRRVEIAKGLLHQPRLLLLDEPSTGLDPLARADMWNYLEHLRTATGMTIVFTTHLLEEAERADRIALVSQGSLIALGTPDELRATVGGDTIVIETELPEQLAKQIETELGFAAQVVDGCVRLEQPEGHRLVARLVEAFPGQVQSIRLGKPTLEDVFIARTGHRFWQAEAVES